MSYLMGIDLGSTSLKAIVYDLQGNAVASASRPTQLTHPEENPDWAVWLPEHIWGGAAEAVKEAVSKLDDPSEIKGVAVTGMGMDGVPVDSAGNWLYPLISWHDTRTMPQLEWWQENIGAEKTFGINGFTLFYFCTALRFLWMKEHRPDVLERTEKWLVIEDFLNFMLCGEYATDYTMASCTLLFDQTKLDWSDELLRQSGIDRAWLSDCHPSATPLGKVHTKASEATGLPVGTPVVLGGHDFLCGSLPVGGFKPGLVLDVTGTWEVVLTATDAPVLTSEVQKTGMVVEAHVARNRYAAWGGGVAAGMLEWYKAQYGAEAERRAREEGGADWQYLIAEAAKAPVGSRGVMFLPHMSAVGCPMVDAKSRGAFVGLTSDATRGDMFRAIIEGLDYQFLDIVRAMEGGLGQSMERIVAVGGAIRNELWMQNKADVVGRPIEVPEVEEATPLGAAILAGIGVGLYKDEEDALQQVYKPGKVFDPDAENTKYYAEAFEVYRQLYPALKSIHHRLGK